MFYALESLIDAVSTASIYETRVAHTCKQSPRANPWYLGPHRQRIVPVSLATEKERSEIPPSITCSVFQTKKRREEDARRTTNLMVTHACKLSLPQAHPTSVVSSLLFESTSRSLALMCTDSSVLLHHPISISSSSSSSPSLPPTLIPPTATSACFLRLHQSSAAAVARVIFLAVGPHRSSIFLRAWILRRNDGFAPAQLNLRHRDRNPVSSGVVLDLSHGFSIKVAGSVNVFVVHSPAAKKIWVLSARLIDSEDGQTGIDLMKSAVIECTAPVCSVFVSPGFLILGEERGVRVFLLKLIAKGRASRKDRILARKRVKEDLNNELLWTRVKNLRKNGSIATIGSDPVIHMKNAGIFCNGGLEAPLDVPSDIHEGKAEADRVSAKHKTVKLRQDSGELGSFFVAFKVLEPECLRCKQAVPTPLKAASIHSLAPKRFLVLDSVGDVHVLNLHNIVLGSEVTEQTATLSKDCHMWHLECPMKARMLAVLPDTSASMALLIFEEFTYISPSASIKESIPHCLSYSFTGGLHLLDERTEHVSQLGIQTTSLILSGYLHQPPSFYQSFHVSGTQTIWVSDGCYSVHVTSIADMDATTNIAAIIFLPIAVMVSKASLLSEKMLLESKTTFCSSSAVHQLLGKDPKCLSGGLLALSACSSGLGDFLLQLSMIISVSWKMEPRGIGKTDTKGYVAASSFCVVSTGNKYFGQMFNIYCPVLHRIWLSSCIEFPCPKSLQCAMCAEKCYVRNLPEGQLREDTTRRGNVFTWLTKRSKSQSHNHFGRAKESAPAYTATQTDTQIPFYGRTSQLCSCQLPPPPPPSSQQQQQQLLSDHCTQILVSSILIRLPILFSLFSNSHFFEIPQLQNACGPHLEKLQPLACTDVIPVPRILLIGCRYPHRTSAIVSEENAAGPSLSGGGSGGASFRLTYLEGNSWLWDVDGVKILVDPILVGNLDFGIPWLYDAAKKVLKNFQLSKLPELDCLVITQSLDDHCHIKTLKPLSGMFPNLRVISTPNAETIMNPLFKNVTYLEPGQSSEIAGKYGGKVTVRATAGPVLGPPWQRPENGYLITSTESQLTLYYEPHCVYNQDSLQKEMADIIITPVIKQLLPSFTLVSGQEDAVALAKLLKAKFIVPMKNGDLDSKGLLSRIIYAEGTVESFKDLLSRELPDAEVLEPQPGIPLEIPAPSRMS
ncbi:hypothetical protein ACLOJK_033092 [Asimina triloba]